MLLTAGAAAVAWWLWSKKGCERKQKKSDKPISSRMAPNVKPSVEENRVAPVIKSPEVAAVSKKPSAEEQPDTPQSPEPATADVPPTATTVVAPIESTPPPVLPPVPANTAESGVSSTHCNILKPESGTPSLSLAPPPAVVERPSSVPVTVQVDPTVVVPDDSTFISVLPTALACTGSEVFWAPAIVRLADSTLTTPLPTESVPPAVFETMDDDPRTSSIPVIDEAQAEIFEVESALPAVSSPAPVDTEALILAPPAESTPIPPSVITQEMGEEAATSQPPASITMTPTGESIPPVIVEASATPASSFPVDEAPIVAPPSAPIPAPPPAPTPAGVPSMSPTPDNRETSTGDSPEKDVDTAVEIDTDMVPEPSVTTAHWIAQMPSSPQ